MSQLSERKLSGIKATNAIRAIQVCFFPNIAYAICPPSSCPIGNKFNAVTNNPIHAANPTGLSMISWLGPRSGYITCVASHMNSESPSCNPASNEDVSTTVDISNPRNRAGIVTMNPAIGPAAPISRSARLLTMGDFILMKAPKVPMNVGAGIKYGKVASTS